jgi:hypothetical protein
VSCHCAFLRAASLGVPASVAFETVLERVKASDGHIRPRKIENQLNCAYSYAGSQARLENATAHITKAVSPWPDMDRDQINTIVNSGPGLYDLWESSPVRFEDDQPHTEDFIDALFPGDPLLCVGSSSVQFDTRSREEWRGQLSELQVIVPHPMTALLGHTKEGKLSAHTLENTGPRRFLVAEFDSGSIDSHAALLHYLAQRGPLVMVVHSGGKSLHGWFWCAGVPDNILRPFFNCAHRLGADKATWLNRSQFVRMPDGVRENGNRQCVYYFNPELVRL